MSFIMENLNIALIGCGMIGREHIERIQNRIRNARIVAVCDVFEEGAERALRSPVPAPRFTPISTKQSTIRT